MNNRLSMQDIIDMLASQHDIPKEDAEKFIVELFNVIELGLAADELVKIKDFGTFKLTLIQERESIDVNTKEKIVIPSHRRVSFIPAPTLKTLVNKPFAHFETTPLNDGIVLENVKEDDPSEDEEDDYISVDTDKPLSTNTINALHESANLIDNIQKSGSDNNKEDSSTEVDSENSFHKITQSHNQEESETPLIADTILPILTIDTEKTTDIADVKSKPKRPFSPWYIATAIFIVLLVLFSYYFHPRNNIPIKQGVEESDIPKPVEESPSVIQEAIPQEVVETVEPVETTKMEAGKTLRLIALDKYGSREFWVYIYLKNKDKIKNPDVIPVGLELVLPRKSEYDINSNNAESVAKAKKLGDEEMKKFW